MAIQKILLPYNFTNHDEKALEFVMEAFCHIEASEVTLFNAYTPLPEITATDSSITGKLRGNLGYLSQKITERESELNDVRLRLIQHGFGENCVKTSFKPRKKDIAGEIIETAMGEKFDVIVLNRKHARVTRFFSGSVSTKVMVSLKDTTVCVVS